MQEQEVLKSPATLIAALRVHTRRLHDEAERAMDIQAPDLTVAGYTEKLRRMHSFYSGLSAAFQGRNSKVEVALARLNKDLKFLTGEDVRVRVSTDSEFFRSLHNPRFCDGVFYVLDGSALGGQVVTKMIQEKLNIHPDTGGAYFYGDGPQVRDSWRKTLAHLAEYDAKPQEWEAVLYGAERAFEEFAGLFIERGIATRN